MVTQSRIVPIIEWIRNDHPAGFAAALHIRLSTPRYVFQGYPRHWADAYAREGMVVDDPTALWGLRNAGACRWSALDVPDPRRIMLRASEEAGLRYGFTVALVRDGLRSIASFARADREPTDSELALGLARIGDLADATRDLQALSPEEHDHLHALAVHLTRG